MSREVLLWQWTSKLWGRKENSCLWGVCCIILLEYGSLTSLLRTQYQGLDWRGLDHQVIPENDPSGPAGQGSNAENKFHMPWYVTVGGTLMIIYAFIITGKATCAVSGRVPLGPGWVSRLSVRDYLFVQCWCDHCSGSVWLEGVRLGQWDKHSHSSLWLIWCVRFCKMKVFFFS